jgi:hypothetical protein
LTARRATGFLAAWIATTLAWSWPLVWNRFPFVYWDTNSYLHHAAGEHAFLLRPIYYSEFLRLFRGVGGLNVASAAQVALAALTAVVFVFRVVLPAMRARAICIVAVGGALTPAAFHFCTIMPDAFAFVFAVALAGIAVEPAPLPTCAWAISAAMAGSVHFSFFALGIAIAPAVVLAAAAARSGSRRALAAVAGALILMAVSICANSALAGAGFQIASPGPIFLAARLSQDRTLSPILRHRAAASADPAERRRLIEFAEEAERLPPGPDPFLWSPMSPMNRHFPNHWNDLAQFFRLRRFCSTLVSEGLMRYPGPFLVSGLKNVIWMTAGKPTLANFIRLPVSTGIEASLHLYRSIEDRSYRSGRQSAGEIPAVTLRALVRAEMLIDPALFLAGAAALALLIFGIVRILQRRVPLPKASAAAFVLLSALVINVLICGFISAASSRYHERMILAGVLGLALWTFADRPGQETRRARLPGPL